ncbi:MAG: sensor histidine kinase [Actinomycetaceae bacterium]
MTSFGGRAEPDAAPAGPRGVSLRAWWPTDRPSWHTVLYLVFVVGDHVSGLTQSDRATWQAVLAWVLLPALVAAALRRTSRPLALPVLGIASVALTGSSLLPVAVLSLVLRRRDRAAAVILVLAALALLSPWADPATDLSATGELPGWFEGRIELFELAAGVVAEVVVPALLGSYLAVRRRLTEEESARARLDAEARTAREREAVLAERRRIAAEMHDAVGHQLALINLQAGALEVNPGAGAEVVERHAAAVRVAATGAARDLREILDVLGTDDAPAEHAPLPGLADVPALLERAGRAGAEIRTELVIAPSESLDPAVGRAAYRIVQEATTNALTHAPGMPIDVSVSAVPGDGVLIAVVNDLPPAAPAGSVTALLGPNRAQRSGTTAGDAHPGRPGLGLGGLAERARSVAGTLSAGPEPGASGDTRVRTAGDRRTAVDGHGRTARRRWAVRARLPWPKEER